MRKGTVPVSLLFIFCSVVVLSRIRFTPRIKSQTLFFCRFFILYRFYPFRNETNCKSISRNLQWVWNLLGTIRHQSEPIKMKRIESSCKLVLNSLQLFEATFESNSFNLELVLNCSVDPFDTNCGVKTYKPVLNCLQLFDLNLKSKILNDAPIVIHV